MDEVDEVDYLVALPKGGNTEGYVLATCVHEGKRYTTGLYSFTERALRGKVGEALREVKAMVRERLALQIENGVRDGRS